MVFTRLLSVNDYPAGMTKRKHWELALTLETLAAGGALRPDATILGVGAGTEPTIFDLSTLVGRVIATDIYANAGMWASNAPADMLTNPAKYAPERPYDLSKIEVLHMDGRAIELPDESVDGIFSCGSIEHFGTWADIERAAGEIGRVLKPGGIVSLCTEYKLNLQPGDGWDGVKLFDRQGLIDHLITPSGLALYDNDDLSLRIDPETFDTAWELGRIVSRNEWPPVEGVLIEHGYHFTSVHIALVKPVAKPKRRGK